MDNNLVEDGPWRATRLWNSIVRSLHDGIPLKKHRKHLRTYEDCFTANEAIEWLHHQLQKNPNFDSEVSREQTLMLLQKLLRAGVIIKIEDDLSLSNTMLSKTPKMLANPSSTGSNNLFKPGNDLYRLAPRTEALIRTPGKQRHGNYNGHVTSRSPLADLSNTATPIKSRGSNEQVKVASRQLNRSSNQGLKSLRSSFRKIKNKHRDFLKSGDQSGATVGLTNSTTDDEADTHSVSEIDVTKRQNLNLSYLQSLPANSLVVLDNDSTWKEVYLSLLRNKLSDLHVNSILPNINVSNIIYNMTKISDKGVVQLYGTKRSDDLPKWTLSAMKCLANWPKPFQAFQETNYNGFEIDVFNVVKEYFTSLTNPLTTFELFDVFVSAFVRAEAMQNKLVITKQPANRESRHFAVTPKPYLETDLDLAIAGNPTSTSTPTGSTGFYSPIGMENNFYRNSRLLTTNERTAHIRQTLQVMPPQQSSSSLDSQSPHSVYSKRLNANMSPTAIMRNFLPPNTCFETAFMHEDPITRIVPQKVNDIIHFRNGYSTSNNSIRPPSRAQSCQAPLPSIGSMVSSTGWDSRSIATQTSDEESHENTRGPSAVSNVERRLRQPKWRRMARQRKSIAVMETNQETIELTNRFRSSSCSSSTLTSSAKQLAANKPFRTSGSVDDLIAGDENQKQFLAKYEKMGQDEFDVQPRRQRRFSMVSLPATSSSSVGVIDLDPPKMKNSSSPPDNMILSKTVRKEKRKQRDRKTLQTSMDRNVCPQQHLHESSPQSMVSSSVSSLGSTLTACNHYRTLGQYRHLTVKTPIHICGHNAPIPSMDEGMQSARAIPFKESADYVHSGTGIILNPRGKQCAIESFQLLGLLLPPEHRRRLQLLLKFMRRVSSKHGLKISTHPTKNCHDVVLETFSESILKPKRDFANYDEDLCKKIVGFFMENYDEIWTPPVCLRKEVEDKVYQSLVNKRLEAGEDPYPITFCKRVPSKVYEKQKISAVQAAMLDLLEQILVDHKMSLREKKKKLKKFKIAYPEVYAQKFPTNDDEPSFMRSVSSGTLSLFKIKSVMRI